MVRISDVNLEGHVMFECSVPAKVRPASNNFAVDVPVYIGAKRMMQEYCRLPFLKHLKPILVVSFIVLVHIVEDRYVVRAGIFGLQTLLGILLISDMSPTYSF